MTHYPSLYRERYGSVYVVEIQDGLVVPFKLLSIQEYFSYQKSFDLNLIALPVLENEIFTKCVVDEVLVDNIHKQKAGTVSQVSNTIMEYSSPHSLEEFEFYLNKKREQTDHIIHQSINTICIAYPGYTPDDLYSMDIEDLMFRLALAERKLLETGFLQEPISFNAQKKQPAPQKKRSKIDPDKLKAAYEAQKINPPPPPTYRKGDETVVSLEELKHNLDFDQEIDGSLDKQMRSEAKELYKPYLDALKRGEKVKIKSHEERVEEAKQRMERNRLKLQEQMKKAKESK